MEGGRKRGEEEERGEKESGKLKAERQ